MSIKRTKKENLPIDLRMLSTEELYVARTEFQRLSIGKASLFDRIMYLYLLRLNGVKINSIKTYEDMYLASFDGLKLDELPLHDLQDLSDSCRQINCFRSILEENLGDKDCLGGPKKVPLTPQEQNEHQVNRTEFERRSRDILGQLQHRRSVRRKKCFLRYFFIVLMLLVVGCVALCVDHISKIATSKIAMAEISKLQSQFDLLRIDKDKTFGKKSEEAEQISEATKRWMGAHLTNESLNSVQTLENQSHGFSLFMKYLEGCTSSYQQAKEGKWKGAELYDDNKLDEDIYRDLNNLIEDESDSAFQENADERGYASTVQKNYETIREKSEEQRNELFKKELEEMEENFPKSMSGDDDVSKGDKILRQAITLPSNMGIIGDNGILRVKEEYQTRYKKFLNTKGKAVFQSRLDDIVKTVDGYQDIENRRSAIKTAKKDVNRLVLPIYLQETEVTTMMENALDELDERESEVNDQHSIDRLNDINEDFTDFWREEKDEIQSIIVDGIPNLKMDSDEIEYAKGIIKFFDELKPVHEKFIKILKKNDSKLMGIYLAMDKIEQGKNRSKKFNRHYNETKGKLNSYKSGRDHCFEVLVKGTDDNKKHEAEEYAEELKRLQNRADSEGADKSGTTLQQVYKNVLNDLERIFLSDDSDFQQAKMKNTYLEKTDEDASKYETWLKYKCSTIDFQTKLASIDVGSDSIDSNKRLDSLIAEMKMAERDNPELKEVINSARSKLLTYYQKRFKSIKNGSRINEAPNSSTVSGLHIAVADAEKQSNNLLTDMENSIQLNGMEDLKSDIRSFQKDLVERKKELDYETIRNKSGIDGADSDLSQLMQSIRIAKSELEKIRPSGTNDQRYESLMTLLNFKYDYYWGIKNMVDVVGTIPDGDLSKYQPGNYESYKKNIREIFNIFKKYDKAEDCPQSLREIATSLPEVNGFYWFGWLDEVAQNDGTKKFSVRCHEDTHLTTKGTFCVYDDAKQEWIKLRDYDPKLPLEINSNVDRYRGKPVFFRPDPVQ